MTASKTKRAAIAALAVNEEVTAETLLEAARDPNHPLHDDFVWDEAELEETLKEKP